jgi:hypothetical protein
MRWHGRQGRGNAPLNLNGAGGAHLPERSSRIIVAVLHTYNLIAYDFFRLTVLFC